MNCRQFEHLWSTRASDELPPAMRAHQSSCPLCAALAREDTAADAALRRLGAAQPAPDVDRARIAIRRALEPHSARPASWSWRRPLLITTAGLAVAAVILALLWRWPVTRQVVVRRPSLAPADLPREANRGKMPNDVQHPEHPVANTGPTHPQQVPKTKAHSWALPEDRRVVHGPEFHGPGPHAPRTQRPGTHAPGTRGPETAPIPHAPALPPPSPRNAPDAPSSADLLALNEGSPTNARPFAPEPAPAFRPLSLPPVQSRKPGSVLVDDLLNLNPVRLAGLGDAGLGAALRTIAAEEPATDPRLQQKVCVHATMQRLGDLLSWLSKATGVTLMARLEVADEKVTLWAEDRPLMDVMRDLRHLRGYYWSRSKRNDQYVYSLWQDAQGRALEEAELQRLAMKLQREFADNIRKHVKALNAREPELERLAQDDPYLAAQMLHPVVRAGYQLFAALSPDQQTQLTQGQMPSQGLSAGELLDVGVPMDRPNAVSSGTFGGDFDVQHDPRGDIVTLPASEMTPEQRAAAQDLLRSAATQLNREARALALEHPEASSHWASTIANKLRQARWLADGDLKTAAVTFFRWGDPNWQGLSLRLEFLSQGRSWGLYSNIGVPPTVQKSYGDDLRKGQFQVWPGAQDAVNRYLRAARKSDPPAAAPNGVAPPGNAADPILDAPVSVTWALRLRDAGYKLQAGEVLAALCRDIGRPLVLDGMPVNLEQSAQSPAEFRWEKRPLRGLLQRIYPGWECHTYQGAIFLRDPERLRGRLNAVPRAVTDFLWEHKGPFTLDDMALVARSLSPWQIVKLEGLPRPAIEQLLTSRELLMLYGELAPAQRPALARGLPFTALTPTQQALFIQFAERKRPFIEPWQFQNGSLRMTVEPLKAPGATPDAPPEPVARAAFQVRFADDETQSFPVSLYPQLRRDRWNMTVADRVGKPFPFPSGRWLRAPEDDSPASNPALADDHLQKRPLVILIHWPFAEPYVGAQAAPDASTLAHGLAEHLRDTGVTVVDVRIQPGHTNALPPGEPLPNLISLRETGDINGQALNSAGAGEHIDQSPTLFVVGSDSIVRAVFEGRDAWDTARVEAAARHLTAIPVASRPASR